MNKAIAVAKSNFLYWSLGSTHDIYVISGKQLVLDNNAYAEWYTPFKTDIPFWTIEGGLQYSGTGTNQPDNLSIDTAQAQQFLVKGGEIQFLINVIDQRVENTSDAKNIVGALQKQKIHVEIYVGKLKFDGGVAHKPYGQVPICWHPSMIQGLSKIAYVLLKVAAYMTLKTN